MVRQQTGEDWRNVDLTLSTARPSVGGAPPELSPWWVSFYRPQTIMRQMIAEAPAPVYERAAKAGRMQMDTELAGEAPAAFETAQIAEEQSSVAFHVPRRLDIPSDGTRHGTVVAIEQ